MGEQPQKQRPSNGDVTLVGLFGEFRYFEGSMTRAMVAVEKGQEQIRADVKSGFADIGVALRAELDGDEDIRRRLTSMESKQAIVYRILGAIGLIMAGAIGELIRRAVMS